VIPGRALCAAIFHALWVGDLQNMEKKLAVEIQRFSVTSSKPFEEVLAAIDAAVGHPDLAEFHRKLASTKTYTAIEKIVHEVIGASGLMEFIRFDLGGILRKERGDRTPRILRLVIGNPLIMKQMVEHVPDAGSYVPVTILIDERADGVHLSYDTIASAIAPCGSREASKIAHDLDNKVIAMLEAAAD
jgi:uncharacterized protein (DUF302 family)